MDLPFIGKWSMTTAAGDAVYADPTTGKLMVGAAPDDAHARFNVYGTAVECILQAGGGSYVASVAGSPATTFTASLRRDANPAKFAITVGSGENVSVAWLARPGAAQGWADAKGALTAGSGAGAQFARKIVTPALDGLDPEPGTDLSWVYLAGADLTSLPTLDHVDLTGADLTGGAKLAGVALSSAILTHADLTGADLTGLTDLSDAHMEHADFTNAQMDDAVMEGVHADSVILNGARMPRVKLADATLTSAKLIEAKLTGFGTTVVNVDFTGADLTGADFTGASVGALTLNDATLTNVLLSNPEKNPSIDLSDVKLNAKTNLTGAHLRHVDLRGKDLSNVLMGHADLTGSKLDKAILIGAEMAYVTLIGATLTGAVAMFGANLSNATLTGANLAGAQLGSISVLFKLVDDSSGKAAYTAFLNALGHDDSAAVIATFCAQKIELTNVSVAASPSAPGRVWSVNAAQGTYTVRLEPINDTQSLTTYQPQTAAILVNAYMKDVILTSANLYNVSASGAQVYGKALLDGHVILEGADFSDANLSGVNFAQAQLYGVTFAHATLVGAKFDGAQLTPSAAGHQVSFANANLPGAVFTDAVLTNAVFTDAAVAVAGDDGKVVGVWLFSSTDPAPITAQLTAAVKQFSLPVKLAAELKQPTATATIIQAFANHNITLSATAVVVAQAQGPLWVITDEAVTYHVFQAADQNGVPALGVSKTAVLAAAFTIPVYLQDDLNTGPVSDAVVKAFTKAHTTLATTAKVLRDTMTVDWQLVDAAAGSFDLWLGIDIDSLEMTISARPSMPAVIDFFSAHSLPLGRRATVTTKGAGRWAVDNDSNNPFNPVTNYVKCNLLTNAVSGTLDAYGSALRVLQVGPDGKSVFSAVQISLTTLTQDRLTPSTVCPNSARTKTNLDEKLPFAEWMRARELPKPPFCVPSADGAFYCPPPRPS